MKLNFPSTLHKELQNVIAVVCLETIFRNEKANKLELERMISDFYHGVPGNKDFVPETKLFLEGRNSFVRAFDRRTLDNVNPTKPVEELVLKDILSRRPDKKFFVGDADGMISLDLLTRATLTKEHKVSGESLYNRALTYKREVIKAIAFGAQFLKPDGTFPTGTTVDDYYDYILLSFYH
jgi:hypothetical protein